MSPAQSPVKVGATLAEAVWLTAAVWVLRGYVWPWLSPVEVPPLQAALDPALFGRDFVVQESLRFTPRFYYDVLVLLPARAGLPLAGVFAAWHLVALGSLVLGLRALARALALGPVAAAVFVVWTLNVTVGELGAVFWYTHAPVPAVWAGAVGVWGLVAAVRGRWTAAYAWFGAAALLQFLVGFFPGLLALPALFHERRGIRAATALAAWGLGLAAVYVPMRASGATGTGGLASAVFVEIYARLRHPHHLVPTAWGWAAWVQATLFYLGALWCGLRLGAARTSRERWLLGGALALTGFLLAANCLFIEVWPSAIIAKLQPARATPFAQLGALALLACVVQARATRGDAVGASLVAVAPLSPFPGFLLVVAAILLPEAKARFTWHHAVLAVATLLAFHGGQAVTLARAIRYGLWVATGLALLVPCWLAYRPRWLGIAATLGGAGAIGLAVASLSPAWPAAWSMRFAIDAAPYDIPGRLGQRFGHYTPKDALVLVPPASDAWAFKLYAQRAIVVDDKHFPFTDHGIAEWKRRMDDVLGQPLVRHLDAEAAWAAEPPARLAALAAKYGAAYILTRDDWHPQLPGTRVDREAGWSVWRLTP